MDRISGAVLAILSSYAAGADAPVARVAGGLLRGALEEPGAVFKGVPFAAAPAGALRWREPQPVGEWKGERDATRMGPACVQSAWGTGAFLQPLAQLYGREYKPPQVVSGEDCLYLNVWTPQWPPAGSRSPVMVWIHGGSNVAGSGGQAAYNAANLARRGVVVVTINYRLGAFGFFAHPELTRESPHHASGNYGLLDQIAALQWVRGNIAAFGGDGRRVTVFGESAGSINIGLLLTSPLAAGLFQRAIMESGPALGLAMNLAPLEKGEQFGAKAGASLAALRALPAQEVVETVKKARAKEADPGFLRDGWCLRRSAAETFASGAQMPVEMMIGNNGRELSAFRVKTSGEGATASGLSGDALKAVRVFYGRSTYFVAGAVMADSLLRRTAAMDDWLNDVACACPAMAMAVLHGETGRRTYIYQFLRSVPGPGERTLGSFHSLELPYVSGSFRSPEWAWLPFEERDLALGEAMQKYWTNFAKTGNPNGADLPGWTPFDARSHAALVIGRDATVTLRRDARPAFCDLALPGLRERLEK